MKTQTPPTEGRDPLCWVVVNPEGKLLAILDSESEAYWFTRNRGHAEKAVYFKAPMVYVAAPDLLEALNACLNDAPSLDHCQAGLKARAAISKATGGQP